METKKPLEGTETHIIQVGVVVKDLDKTMEYLTTLGFGPFAVRTVNHPSATVHGKKVSYEVKIAMAQQGPVQLELIEYKKGTTIHKEFFDEKGEGIHHILFKVQDIDATQEKFARLGIKPLQYDRFITGGGMAYLDTANPGGIIVELVQHPPGYDPKVGVKYKE
jgi:methylmalonyl-CoA/ethylmalonyl-CoA epimerase